MRRGEGATAREWTPEREWGSTRLPNRRPTGVEAAPQPGRHLCGTELFTLLSLLPPAARGCGPYSLLRAGRLPEARWRWHQAEPGT